MNLHDDPVAVGDRVYDVVDGWGTVVFIEDAPHPPSIRVRFDETARERVYDPAGMTASRAPRATLYWQDPVLAPPPKEVGAGWALLRRIVTASVARFREHGEL